MPFIIRKCRTPVPVLSRSVVVQAVIRAMPEFYFSFFIRRGTVTMPDDAAQFHRYAGIAGDDKIIPDRTVGTIKRTDDIRGGFAITNIFIAIKMYEAGRAQGDGRKARIFNEGSSLHDGEYMI